MADTKGDEGRQPVVHMTIGQIADELIACGCRVDRQTIVDLFATARNSGIERSAAWLEETAAMAEATIEYGENAQMFRAHAKAIRTFILPLGTNAP